MTKSSYEDQLSDSALFADESESATESFGEFTDESDADDLPQEEPLDSEESTYSEFVPAPERGMTWWCIGGFVTLVGAAFAVMSALGDAEAMPWFVTSGVTQGTVVTLGILLFIAGSVIRANDQSANFVAAEMVPLHDLLQDLHGRLDTTIDHEQFAAVPAHLHRLDEKISNLSRATKMYGKPLLDVANRMQEAANHLTEIERSLDSVVEQVKSSSSRLGEDVGKLMTAVDRADPFPKEEIDKLIAASMRSTELIEEVREEIATKPESSGEVKASIQSMLDKLESVQGDVKALSDRVASIRVAPAATATVAATTPTATAAKAPAPSPQTAAAPADAPAGVANSIAGERKSKGKNVLGAIAKLKQMRN